MHKLVVLLVGVAGCTDLGAQALESAECARRLTDVWRPVQGGSAYVHCYDEACTEYSAPAARRKMAVLVGEELAEVGRLAGGEVVSLVRTLELADRRLTRTETATWRVAAGGRTRLTEWAEAHQRAGVHLELGEEMVTLSVRARVPVE